MEIRDLYKLLDKRGSFCSLSIIAYCIGFTYYGFYFFIKPVPHFFWFIDWISTQYFVNYFDFGFLRRGLLGSVLYPIFYGLDPSSNFKYFLIIFLHILNFLIITLIFHTFITQTLHLSKSIRHFWLCFFILSPFGAMQFGFDVGRTDHYLFSILIISLWCLIKAKVWMCSILLSISILIHEVSLFFSMPIIVFCTYLLNQEYNLQKFIAECTKIMALPLLCVFVLFFYGTPEIGRFSLLHSDLSSGINGYVRGTFEPQLAYTVWWHKFAVIFYSFLPLLLIARFFLAENRNFEPVYLSGLLPLLLFLFGVDYARWSFIIAITCGYIFAIKILLAPKDVKNPNRFDKLVFVILLLPLGPIGIIEPLPLLNGLIELFEVW